MYTTPQLAAEYSAIADPYSRLWSPVIRPMALPILEMLPLGQARDVLDVGAGTGELLEDLARCAPRAQIVAVDRSEGMLRLAQVRGARFLAAMDAQLVETTIKTYLTEIRSRLDKAAGIGRAADACAGAGFHEKGLEVALDMEQLLYEATTLLNAASLINRISQQS